METTIQTGQRVKTAYNLMRFTFGLVPIIAGLDKFTNLLTNWEQYLHPVITQVLPFSPHTFMMIVGIIEITAGVIVLWKPAVGGYIVMAWLALIAISLLASLKYLDIAVRDLVMAIGAFSLVQLARTIEGSKIPETANRKIAFS
jgi:energy-converting hydrogenase Eha subunit C